MACDPTVCISSRKKNISWEKQLPANETKKSSKDITWRLLLWLSYYSVCIDILLMARVRNRELIAGVLWALAARLAKKRLIKSKNTVKHTTIKIRANKAYRVSCNITFAMNFHQSSPITTNTMRDTRSASSLEIPRPDIWCGINYVRKYTLLCGITRKECVALSNERPFREINTIW